MQKLYINCLERGGDSNVFMVEEGYFCLCDEIIDNRLMISIYFFDVAKIGVLLLLHL